MVAVVIGWAEKASRVFIAAPLELRRPTGQNTFLSSITQRMDSSPYEQHAATVPSQLLIQAVVCVFT